jgi:hypothetical protein
LSFHFNKSKMSAYSTKAAKLRQNILGNPLRGMAGEACIRVCKSSLRKIALHQASGISRMSSPGKLAFHRYTGTFETIAKPTAKELIMALVGLRQPA